MATTPLLIERDHDLLKRIDAALRDIETNSAYIGRGPREIRAYLIDDLLLVRIQRVLTGAEHHLVRSHASDRGRDLLKQMRAEVVDMARPLMEEVIAEVTGVSVVSVHHDLSTVTGEEFFAFTLNRAPSLRATESPRRAPSMNAQPRQATRARSFTPPSPPPSIAQHPCARSHAQR